MHELEKMMENEEIWEAILAEETRTRELLDRYLGRPLMLVTGIPVTQQQAMEIIRRTDRLFRSLSTNNYSYLVRIARTLRIPLWEDYERELRRDEGYVVYEARLDALRGSDAYRSALSGEHYDAYLAAHNRHREAQQRWLEAWGYVETEYVCNDWISDQYIYGAHGWCHPDGTLGHIDSVGKGQIGEEIHRDWCILARAFPFLDLGVTLVREGLYEGEKDFPQVGFLVSGGKVKIVDPVEVDVHVGHSSPTRRSSSRYSSDQTAQDNLASLLSLSRLFGQAPSQQDISWSWVTAWASQAPLLQDP